MRICGWMGSSSPTTSMICDFEVSKFSYLAIWVGACNIRNGVMGSSSHACRVCNQRNGVMRSSRPQRWIPSYGINHLGGIRSSRQTAR